MPPPDDLKLSVFLIQGDSEPDIWNMGRRVLDEHPSDKLHGRADINVGAVQNGQLKAFRDDDPPKHVNIVGWPSYEDGKDRIKSIAQELALNAVVVLLDPPITKDHRTPSGT